MDNRAISIIRNYIIDNTKNVKDLKDFDLYIVWKSKVIQNWKYLIASTLIDGMYYELTYNGDKEEWYIDAYKKVENVVIAGIY